MDRQLPPRDAEIRTWKLARKLSAALRGITSYHEANQAHEEQQEARTAVVENLALYLTDKVGSDAVRWLQLYLQGKTQEAIALDMNLPIKQIYRLREKVGYHAIKVFAAKRSPELVAEWLKS